ncbi:LamG-like jellyroll fold domain-containing protein [Chitinophaga tropicalis]|uniref:T9SS type A sorting domain-containing protein n=1 Tax=Chitinophaga tropicalis TaxID=2683588 RepID=A0A7K1U368_9BACT|nr:LamG-like jellyroll fold domain-containing protein [Chitinophaga tropicalis]MVT08799.1 T9SS type A sorting domain-containing protein [Chitinophaga tropicalis]
MKKFIANLPGLFLPPDTFFQLKGFSNLIIFVLFFLVVKTTRGQTFVHPGGVHTRADLDRMKEKVAAGAYPWIDGWNLLRQEPKAQKTYVAKPSSNIGGSGIRQQAAKDATAAYFNALEWYISGDTAYANCAMRILNAWSGSVNQVVSGELFQIPICLMVQAAEILRIYPGWTSADFSRFKNMCLNYFYPACHDFLGECGSWPGWDAPALAAVLYIGVLCEDQAKFNEAVDYYKNGVGGGNLLNNVVQLSGQLSEMGRDQPHAEIGPQFAAEMCQTALNQGVDLFSYANNRLLSGFEYYCKFSLNNPVSWIPYNDCANNNFYYPAMRFQYRINVSPVYELIYNYYVIKKGLSAPYTRAMVNLRGLLGTPNEYLGYCALTYTLSDTTTIFQPKPIPPAPTGLTAVPGVSNIQLRWMKPVGEVANGYNVLRATASGGPYTTIASWNSNTSTEYIDKAVTNGTTYYYRVSANNQSGASPNSSEVSAKPVSAQPALPAGWALRNIGNVGTAGTATYADVNNKTFVLKASGNGFGSSNDAYGYIYTRVTGDFTLTTRLSDASLSTTNADRAGLVMRESFSTNAAIASIGLADNGFRKVWFATHATGANTLWVSGDTHTWLPVWFRLQRSGNTFTGYQSLDGVTWFTVGTTTIAMPNSYYVGMYANSGSSTFGITTTVTFDNLTASGGGSAVPPPPAGFSATPGNTQDSLKWDTVSEAACYNIKRADTSGGPYTAIATGITSSGYLDTGLVNGHTYYYVVTAANIMGEGPGSVEANATPVLSLAPVPTGFSATSVSERQINLQWTASVSATSYKIKRAATSGGPFYLIDSVAGTSYSDTTVITDSVYYYVISAVNPMGETANSTEVKATPGCVGYWKFDENNGIIATDSWNDYDGQLSSGAAWTTGAINSGVKLDGSGNAFVTLPAGILSGINDFTFAAWVKIDAAANWARIFDFGNGTSSYMFLGRSNTGGLRYAITSGGGGGEQGINSSIAVPVGEWRHVVVTWKKNTGIMYINGIEVGRNDNMSLKPSDLGATIQNWFGRSQYSGDPELTGVLDEVRIYNRALSATEAHDLSILPVPPLAPVSLSITGGNNTVSLNWTAPAGTTSYHVKRGTSASGPFTTIATVTTNAYVDSTAFNCTDYFYVVAAVNSRGEGNNSAVAGLSTGGKQSGRLIGTPGSWGNNAGTTRAAAVDGNIYTYFDGPVGTAWVGYDFGADSGLILNKVRYAPRPGYGGRMAGGRFQGSTDSAFTNPVTLFTITTAPVTGTLTEQAISNMIPFRYIRYISPSDGFGNAAEIEFYGLSGGVPQLLLPADTLYLAYDSSFSYSIETANRPRHYTVSGLPDGLNLDTCSGVIAGAPAAIGTFPVSLTIANAWGTTSDTVVLVIRKNQVITFPPIPGKSTGDADFVPTATTSSGLPVDYSSSDTTVAVVTANGKIHITGAGFADITAYQNGNAQYYPALPTVRRLQVFTPDCGIFNNKVTVCHNGFTICIVASAVPEHLNHGDILGICPCEDWIAAVQEKSGLSVTVRSVEIYPNPSAGSFFVQLAHFRPGKAVINITDRAGQLIRQFPVIITGDIQKIALNAGLVTPGLYYIQIISTETVETKTLFIQQ